MTKCSMRNLFLTGLSLLMTVLPWAAIAEVSPPDKPDINAQIEDLLQGDWGQITFNL